ncbi:MAG TPA: L,D-transpeptidase family protein [Myxococcota bacterium]|nr:L,D-transpeptidase family protein [Myxococcota bacterium]
MFGSPSTKQLRLFLFSIPALLAISGLLPGCTPDRPASRAAGGRTAVVSPEQEAVGAEPLESGLMQMWNALNSSRTVVRARQQDSIAGMKEWSEAVTSAMDAIEWQPVFTDDTGTTDLFDKLLAALEALPAHGLELESSGLPELKTATEAYAPGVDAESEILAGMSDLSGWEKLSGLVDRREKPTAEEIASILEDPERISGDDLAKLVEGVGKLAAIRKEYAAPRGQVESLGILAYMKYAMNMRFRVVADPFMAQRNPATAHRQFTQKLIESLKSFIQDPDTTLSKLPPSHPYYAKTMAGLAAYLEMAAKGDFPEVRIPRKMAPGTKSSLIPEIKNRLAREGYFSGDSNEKFDDDLKQAVIRYQETHGFNPTGVLEPSHGKSMNIPVSKRIEQIRLSLQRWRESEIRDGGELYVRVNIPQFMMEVWEGSERKFRNRVVVGNNGWDTDPGAKVEGRINRTKIFSAQIQDIVLNPRWNVPMRIRKVELEMDLLSQPDYLLKNNYVVEMLPDGREIVYQKSGDGNALGRIKFNFPNQYGIFMHDTNLKRFFGKEIRAFSHGCVRLDDPVPIAKYLISVASETSPDEVDRELAKAEPDPRSVKLSRPVPIYIEYNSAGPDDDGKMMFFSDIYNYDRDYFAGKIPYSTDELELLRRKITQPD